LINVKEECEMKARKISMMVAVVLFAGLLMASTASAAWYTCTIDKVGVNPTSGYIVYVTSANATPDWAGSRWYVFDVADEKTFMAIALTAYANGKKVSISITSKAVGSACNGLLVMD